METDRKEASLVPRFTPLAVWAFSIGTSIGWGSFIVTCNTYLQKSGILGTVFGLLVGMAVVLVITWNLQAMILKSPDAGGIYTFEKRIGGRDLGFLAFWFVLLTYMAILWANMTSLPLFARFFLGDTFRFGFHYQIFGYEVWFGEVLLSACSAALIGLLCAKSARLPNRIMVVAALAFAVCFTACAVIVLFRHESAFSFSPFYTEGSSAFVQIVRIAAISPWAFIGFENVSHFSEEYAFPIKRIRGILVCSVVATTLFYLLVSALSISAYPPEYESWLAYIQDMGNLSGIKAVPAFYVAQHYLGDAGVAALMLALFGVILTSLIGNMLALSRLLYAAGREGEAPHALSRLSDRGIPVNAIIAIVAISVIVPFLGRTAIGWIVDVTTLCATIVYGLISHAVWVCSKRDGDRVGTRTGIAGIVLMTCFALLLLVPGLLPFDAMATESYFLFIVWALLGLAYFRQLRRKRSRDYGRSAIVWIALLVLVLFASEMWVSRATEHAANQAVEHIYQYHQDHPEHDTSDDAVRHREEYLQEQAGQISHTNTMYSAMSLGMFLLSLVIMVDGLRENRELGQQLSVAEREAQAAKEIAELKESINSLFDNMPLMSYSKDAETGAYVVCNQAFAEYACKKTPEEVVGLTDYEIFGPEVAKHFVQDDHKAFAMDTSLVFFEEVADAAGRPRSFQTTKLKFYDANGRLCILGMSVDITEMEKAKRESERYLAAYQEALSNSTIYESIVDSLAGDYFNLFYVDLETDAYIEYGSRTEASDRMVETRGTDFFAVARQNAKSYLYEEDQDDFIATMHKERMRDEIRTHGTFIMQYRLMIDGTPTYVNLKATTIAGNERFMIVGVNNIDAQVRERAAARKASEERDVFARLSALNGNMMVLYFVNPQNDHYTEYSATSEFEGLGISKHGDDFFAETLVNSRRVVHPEDQELFQARITKENVMRVIEQDGVFMLDYRLVGGALPTYVRFKAAQIVEHGRPMLIVGVLDEDAQVRREQEFARSLSVAQRRATRDSLTGVRNKHAYADVERDLDDLIEETEDPAFAIVVCDVNDLKWVNDTQGHKAGDQYIRDACAVICDAFKHSPVFRIGGDEFAVICRGHDYDHLDELVAEIEEHNAHSKDVGGIQIAYGAARFDADESAEVVFDRADRYMYKHKAQMKGTDELGARA